MELGSDVTLSGLLKLPEERIMKAVEKTGGRVLAQDVAALAGVDIASAQAGLQCLASLTGGDLEVTQDGEIMYVLPRDFRGVLRSKSTALQIKETIDKVWPYLFYGIRVGFGVMLLISIAVISVAILTISSSSSSSEDNKRSNSRGGGGGAINFNFLGPSPFDFFYYRPYYGYYQTGGRQRGPGEMSFLESLFSYVFGDGDPNAGLQQRSLQEISEVVRSKGGTVTADEIAPYLSPDKEPGGSTFVVDESFVLPAVSALRGVPEVTEEGEIVYVFPELQTTALKSDRNVYRSGPRAIEIAPILEEREIPFSRASGGQLVFGGALGVLNLVGVFVLRNQLAVAAMQGVTGLAGIQALVPFLTAYAVAFNAIPALRFLRNKAANQKIQQRNEIRRSWAQRLLQPSGPLRQKMDAARKRSMNLRVLGKSDVTYTTSKSLSEQTVNPLEGELAEFDKRLKR